MASMTVKKRIFSFIILLKAFAALLIINSHYDSIYPVSALATGGAIGNAVFFAISGFSLHPIDKNLSKWLLPKLIKIYVPTTIMSIIALCTYLKGAYTTSSVFIIFVWPTLYWFVGAIILFYILFYVLRNIVNDKEFIKLFTFLTVIYILYYIFILDKRTWVIETKGLDSIEGCFKLIYYFVAMMIGKWFRINLNKIFLKRKIYICGAILSFFSIYAIKLLIIRIPSLMVLQFLNQVSVLFFIIFIFINFISLEESIAEFKNLKIFKLAIYLSDITLHLYLVQFFVIDLVHGLEFPQNFVAASTLILVLAKILQIASNAIYDVCCRFIYERGV